MVNGKISAVKLLTSENQIIACDAEYSTQSPWHMTLSVPGGEKMEVTERDLFECMVSLRRSLEKKNCKLLCSGARVDVYPSGMSRDMSGGLAAYIQKKGQHAARDQLTNILEYAAPELIGTVDDQLEFHTAWLESLR